MNDMGDRSTTAEEDKFLAVSEGKRLQGLVEALKGELRWDLGWDLGLYSGIL